MGCCMSYTAANEWCAPATGRPSASADPASKIQTLSFISRPPRIERAIGLGRVRDSIDDVAVVVTEQQRAVVRRRYIRGPAPRLTIRSDEADEKIDVLAGRGTVLDRH